MPAVDVTVPVPLNVKPKSWPNIPALVTKGTASIVSKLRSVGFGYVPVKAPPAGPLGVELVEIFEAFESCGK